MSKNLYVLESDRRYKIGVSKAPKKRMEDLQLHSPYKLKLVKIVQTSIPFELESYYHAKFAEDNINGEWFELNEEQIKSINEEIPKKNDTEDKSEIASFTHVGGLEIPDELWIEFKMEAHKQRMNRSELLSEIFRQRYKGKSKLEG